MRRPPSPLGACCVNGTGVLLTQSDCTAIAGQYQGDGVDPESVECPATCQSDLNGDGTVDGQDLTQILADWGKPCGN